MVTNAVISKSGKEIELGADLWALQESCSCKLVLELCLLSAPPDLGADPSRYWKGPNERAHVDTISEDARVDGEVDFKHSCPCTGLSCWHKGSVNQTIKYNKPS